MSAGVQAVWECAFVCVFKLISFSTRACLDQIDRQRSDRDKRDRGNRVRLCHGCLRSCDVGGGEGWGGGR